MNLEMTKTYLIRLVKLVGKRRFARIYNVYSRMDNATPSLLEYKYDMSVTDCWEMTYFDDRLRNNGFYRNTPGAIQYFMKDFIEVMESAKKHNLI